MPQIRHSRRAQNTLRLLQILLILEFLFLCYVNLRLTSHILDGDAADLYGHIMEMGEQRTLFLSGWNYTTTMELDCVTLLALPIYLLTHKIFGSIGIANILFILLLAAVILRVVKNLGGTIAQGTLSILLVLLPYDVGMLDYMDMLLFGGSQYLVKVLVPLLLVALITEPRRRASGILLTILYVFLLFVSSLSSGFYVLLMGILPLLVFSLFRWGRAPWSKEWEGHLRLLVLSILTIAASFPGIALQKALDITTREEELHLIRFEDLATCLLAIPAGLLDIFGIYPSTSTVAVLSQDGVICLLKGGLTLLVLVIGLVVFYRGVIRQKADEDVAILTVLLPFTILIMCFVDTRYSTTNSYVESRYFLIGMVPLLILAGMKLEPLLEEKLRVPAAFLAIALLICMMLLCGSNVLQAAENSNYCYDLLESINAIDADTEGDIGSVFVLGDNDTARILRLLDRSRTYAGSTTDTPSQLELSDNYENYNAKDHFSQQNLVLVIHGTNLTDYLPEETAALYTYASTTDWFDIYYADVCSLGD
ncbi:MAG: hypothetical protein ACI4OJ_01010 [Lachnospiraceae bacterium]